MDKSGLAFLSVAELGRFIKAREVSPAEVTQAYLERIERLNPKLNAYITVTAEEALRSARQAEADINQGRYKGPMHGVPIAVKDQIWTKGIRTTCASTLLKDFIPEEDATIITRLKEAGVVLLGKLNLSEFASGGRFKYPYGVPRNPWNLEYSPGGSSSGSGAATAACLCATSLGEDTMGSIRTPSSWSGVVGLRPTWGRVSRYGLFPIIWSMDAAGPMSRSVEDCAITLGPLCGHDPKDPYTWSVPVPDYRKALTGNIKGLKAGLVREMVYDDQVTPETREATLKAVAVLQELGAEVEEVSIPLEPESRLIFYTLMYVEQPAAYHDWVRNRLGEFDYDNQVNLLTGSLLSGQLYYKAQRLRSLLRGQVLGALQRFQVLVSPTMRRPADKIMPYTMPRSKQEAQELLLNAPVLTPMVPLTGVPALSVPCGFTPEEKGGLPIGLQIIGRPFAEATILNAAYAYEQSTAWHTRRPQI